MRLFNTITSAIFDVILAPLGHDRPWFDLGLWPVFAGVVALLVYKAVSNQKGIEKAKNDIQVHLLEVVLYKDDLLGVLVSTAKALGKNALYLGYNVVPMVVMFVPMTAILVQLVANYAYAPLNVGDTPLLMVKLDENSTVKPKDVSLELPEGVVQDAPPVRTSDGEIAYRLRVTAPGDYTLKLHLGDTVEEKGLSVGVGPEKVPVKRTKSWEGFLYPGEPVPAADSPLYEARIAYPDRDLSPLPSGEGGVLGWFFGFSLVAGFVLKDKFGVTL
jgi:hypothetical protein